MGRVSPSRYLVTCGWGNIPHLDERTKADLLAGTPPYLRKARSEGIPALGSGAIYPVEEGFLSVDPFAIPAWWPRRYGLDVGWRKTAAVWCAKDPETGVKYLYAEYARGEASASLHAEAIKVRGEWIPGAIDPASRGRSQRDGGQLMQDYLLKGLKLEPAVNAVEAGLHEVWSQMDTGQLKVFSTLRSWFEEFRVYRRDDKGKVVKANDHLMDATRYTVVGFDGAARAKPPQHETTTGFRAADPMVGY